MPEIKLQKVYRVDIIESEIGWGQKTIETKHFDNEHEAKSFCNQFNSKNPDGPAPDYYIQAEYVGLV